MINVLGWGWWLWGLLVLLMLLMVLLIVLFIKGSKQKSTGIDDEDRSIRYGYTQHIGDREEQQDDYDVDDNLHEAGRSSLIAVLADGMGGFSLGREAGELAVESMLEQYEALSANSSVPDALEQSLRLTNLKVVELGKQYRLEGQVGTTLVAAVVQDGQLFWISVGDSRIYLYRNSRLELLTRDHISAYDLQELVEAGKLTQEAADSDPKRLFLTSYLGIQELEKMEANQTGLQLEPGDRVLLCSDGLYSGLSESLLEKTSRFTPQQTADYILRKVIEQKKPYQDNATIIVLAYSKR